MKLVITFLLLSGLMLSGCAPTAPKREAAVPPPSFDFTPPATASPGTAEVTLALVNPAYSEADPARNAIFRYYPFADFQRNMGRDFEEMLVARGFSVAGPFLSRDEMTFPDKNGCDLVLTPSLDVSVDFPNIRAEQVIMMLGDNQYKIVGQASVTGRITLSMLESLSGEKMWSKSINIPSATQAVAFTGTKRYNSPPAGVDPTDTGLQQALAPALSQAYQAVMDATWKYIDPQEIQMVKKEAMIVKEKKRY